MDIQVLNEIVNPVRQASLSKVGAPVSASAQLKALKGNPVPVPGNPAPPLLEDSPEQIQAPVTPEISSVARAASDYSEAVGDGLNSDELSAIQDLAGRVRTAVSDFLSQPGLAQAENAATVVASNPEAVQDFTSSVEQAVVATLNLTEIGDEVIVNAPPPNENLEVPALANLISVERITNGAEPNNPAQVVAASPALQNAQAGEHARVETPVSRPEVIAASPALVHSRVSENTNVKNPVTVEEGVEASSRDFTVTAASPALQNAQAGGNAQVETPVSRVVASPQPEAVSRPETVATNPQETPVIAASPALQNANAQSRVVENPVNTSNAPEASNRDFTVTAASSALQNAQAGGNAQVETPVSRVVASPQPEAVSRPETVATNPQETPVTAASPALQNAQAGGNARVETPASRPDAVSSNNQQPSVTAASPALQNAQAQNAKVGSPVNVSAPSVNLGQGSEEAQAQPVNSEGAIASPEGVSNQTASGPSNPQPASVPQPGPAQSSDLFAQERAAVNPENIRNVNELVSSVVDNEFTSEAKKIFSEPKVIRTVADLAEFILERLREIITANQLQKQSQSSGETGLS